MSGRSSSNRKGNHDVGYGKPPEANRFQKGQSGNPKGRPKKAAPAAQNLDGLKTEFEAIAYQIAKRPVTIRDGNKTKSVSMIEAVLRAEAAQAARGKRLDKKDMLERYAKAEADLREEQRQDYEAWNRIKASKIAEYKTMAECDRERSLPHPDDIILGPGHKVTIIGPLTAAELPIIDKNSRMRDLMLLQSMLDLRWRNKNKKSHDFSGTIPISLALTYIFDRLLPLRFRLGSEGIQKATDELLWKSVRDLEDEIRAGRLAMGMECGKWVNAMPSITLEQGKALFAEINKMEGWV